MKRLSNFVEWLAALASEPALAPLSTCLQGRELIEPPSFVGHPELRAQFATTGWWVCIDAGVFFFRKGCPYPFGELVKAHDRFTVITMAHHSTGRAMGYLGMLEGLGFRGYATIASTSTTDALRALVFSPITEFAPKWVDFTVREQYGGGRLPDPAKRQIAIAQNIKAYLSTSYLGDGESIASMLRNKMRLPPPPNFSEARGVLLSRYPVVLQAPPGRLHGGYFLPDAAYQALTEIGHFPLPTIYHLPIALAGVWNPKATEGMQTLSYYEFGQRVAGIPAGTATGDSYLQSPLPPPTRETGDSYLQPPLLPLTEAEAGVIEQRPMVSPAAEIAIAEEKRGISPLWLLLGGGLVALIGLGLLLGGRKAS